MEESKTIEELVREQLEAKKEELIKGGFDAIKQSSQDSFAWQVRQEVSKQIEKMFEADEVKQIIAEIVVEVKQELTDSFKTEIRKMLPNIGAAFATSLNERIVKNLSKDSYHTRDLFKNLLD